MIECCHTNRLSWHCIPPELCYSDFVSKVAACFNHWTLLESIVSCQLNGQDKLNLRFQVGHNSYMFLAEKIYKTYQHMVGGACMSERRGTPHIWTTHPKSMRMSSTHRRKIKSFDLQFSHPFLGFDDSLSDLCDGYGKIHQLLSVSVSSTVSAVSGWAKEPWNAEN